MRHHPFRVRAPGALAPALGWALSALWLLAAAARAEVPELVTDRPDQTESTEIVPVGWIQLEMGWTFARDDEDGVRTESDEVPGTLVRLGLAAGVELRVGWTGQVAEEIRSGGAQADVDGPGDAELGAKIRLRGGGSGPAISALVATSVPVGDDAFTSDRYDPSLRLAFSQPLSARLGLTYNLGVAWASEPGADGEPTTGSSYLYTVALGTGLSDRLGAFVEVFGEIPGSAPGTPKTSFDGGFTFLVRDHLQLDLAGGVGLSEAAEDWFVGVGLSARLPR